MSDTVGKITTLSPEVVAAPLGMYSHASCAVGGSFVFVAGQVAVDASGDLVGADDFEAQLGQVIDNIGKILEAAGSSLRKIAKFTTYLTSVDGIPQFYAARAKLFPSIWEDTQYPPNTLLVVHSLVKAEFLVEIESIAVK